MADGEHAQLLELEAATFAEVEQYAQCSLTDKARVQKLALTIQGRLSKIRALTRDLELLVEELDSDEERHEVAGLLAGHKAEYERIQGAFKAAALAQRTAALRNAADERRELLAGGDAGARQRKMLAEADSVAVAEDVTAGLRRTRQVLAEELEHTSATLAAMEASHAALGRTRDEYQGQHRHLKRSKGLLGTLNWQTKSETYMLWIGLSLFLAVCAYIAQKRAAHFIPDRLKPAALFGSSSMPTYASGGARGSGSRQPPLPPDTRTLQPQRAGLPPQPSPQPGATLQTAVPASVPPPRPPHQELHELPPAPPQLIREPEAQVVGGTQQVPAEQPQQEPAQPDEVAAAATAAEFSATPSQPSQPPVEQQPQPPQQPAAVQHEQPPPHSPTVAEAGAGAEAQAGPAGSAFADDAEAVGPEGAPEPEVAYGKGAEEGEGEGEGEAAALSDAAAAADTETAPETEVEAGAAAEGEEAGSGMEPEGEWDAALEAGAAPEPEGEWGEAPEAGDEAYASEAEVEVGAEVEAKAEVEPEGEAEAAPESESEAEPDAGSDGSLEWQGRRIAVEPPEDFGEPVQHGELPVGAYEPEEQQPEQFYELESGQQQELEQQQGAGEEAPASSEPLHEEL